MLLSLDTSGALVSAAVHDGRAVLVERRAAEPRRHAELLSALVVEALEEAGVGRTDLTGIAVGIGPGPFTGLRAGIVTGQVMGYALGIAVHGVCSLDALAEAAARGGAVPLGQEFLVATDARRREVYWARYLSREHAGGTVVERRSGPSVQEPSGPAGLGLPTIGPGTVLYPGAFTTGVPPAPGVNSDVTAGQIAVLAAEALSGSRPAGAVGVGRPAPLYLRRPDATEPGTRKRVRPVGTG
jgi:tRNA threonylcarbamoyl adenosine modification protein YeaZ